MPYLTFHLDNFILKITVPKVLSEQETSMKIELDKMTDNHLKVSQKLTDIQSRHLIEQLINEGNSRESCR